MERVIVIEDEEAIVIDDDDDDNGPSVEKSKSIAEAEHSEDSANTDFDVQFIKEENASHPLASHSLISASQSLPHQLFACPPKSLSHETLSDGAAAHSLDRSLGAATSQDPIPFVNDPRSTARGEDKSAVSHSAGCAVLSTLRALPEALSCGPRSVHDPRSTARGEDKSAVSLSVGCAVPSTLRSLPEALSSRPSSGAELTKNCHVSNSSKPQNQASSEKSVVATTDREDFQFIDLVGTDSDGAGRRSPCGHARQRGGKRICIGLGFVGAGQDWADLGREECEKDGRRVQRSRRRVRGWAEQGEVGGLRSRSARTFALLGRGQPLAGLVCAEGA